MEPYIAAFCFMLLHSLWIGCIVAVLSWVFLRFSTRVPARFRYVVLCVALFLFVTGVVSMACIEFGSIYVPDGATFGQVSPLAAIPATISDIIPAEAQWNLAAFINRYATPLCTAWALCFLFKTVRVASAFSAIQRLRTKDVFAVEGQWPGKVEEIAIRLGICRKVVLLQSAKVEAPVTIGFLKPVILIPAGMLIQMPPEQIEAVLWHELAHICRRDYLVNFLQELLEAAFFFNPALLWLSSVIREEREMCCDDLVLDNIPHKSDYLHALLAFPFAKTEPSFAMGLAAGQNPLKDRLQRMLGHKVHRPALSIGTLFTACLAVVLAFVVFGVKQEPVQRKNSVAQQAARTTQHALNDAGSGLSPEITTAEVISPRAVVKSTPVAKQKNAQTGGELPVETDAGRIRAVLAELVRKGIVADTDAIEWFALSDTELVVNGAAQPTGLQQEFKVKFAVEPGYGLYYGPVQVTGKGFFVDKQELAAL